MMDREEIIAYNPIEKVIMQYGITASKRTPTGFTLKCPFHDDKNPSLSVDVVKGLFKCFGCGAQGSVIDFVMLKDGVDVKEAMRRLSKEDPKPYKPIKVESPPANGTKPKEVAVYGYRDELGAELYQVVRFEPKDFRQRHKEGDKWVWSMNGVRRVLYNLPLILKANTPYVWIVEGEKDADNLKKCGYVATCNVGGAGKWMDGYTESLRGKEIVICGDNDDAGRAHVQKVTESIAREVKCIHKVTIPAPHKDVSDFIASFPDFESAARELYQLFEDAPILTQGIEVPVLSMGEMERRYQRHVSNSKATTLDLSHWIPTLGRSIRGLCAGELITILAATGVGKTACLQTLAISAAPLPTLLFELELPEPLTFERFAASATDIPAPEVHARYNAGDAVDWRATKKLDHISVCSQARVSPEDIERIILQTELKTGRRPVLVGIDYMGLVRGTGKSRYERSSDAAEALRIVAKSTGTIIAAGCQIGRKKDDESPAVELTDAKDSGSIENSSSLVLGVWRDQKNASVLIVKVLKNTKGKSGCQVSCNYHGETTRITEMSKVAEEDIPQPSLPIEVEQQYADDQAV